MQCGQSKGDDLAVGAIGVEVRALPPPLWVYPSSVRSLGRDGVEGLQRWLKG